MPAVAAVGELEGLEAQPSRRRQTAWGCSKCKVNLCSELCFAAFDHVHCCHRREVVVQDAQVQEVVMPPMEQCAPAMDSGRRPGGSEELLAGLGVEPKGAPKGAFGSK